MLNLSKNDNLVAKDLTIQLSQLETTMQFRLQQAQDYYIAIVDKLKK